jgi:hypothetical protein
MTNKLLPTYNEVLNFIGVDNKGRSEITNFYDDFINCEINERLPYYGALIGVLLEYVNYNDVTDKAIKFFNKFHSRNQNIITSLSQISCNSLNNVPIETLDKIVSRLIRYWMVDRIASAELINHLCKQVNIEDVKFIANSEFTTEGDFSNYALAHESGQPIMAIDNNCRSIIERATTEYDYSSIGLDYLVSIHQDIIDAINSESPILNTKFVDEEFILMFNNKCLEYDIDQIIVLTPFCRFPDIRVLHADQSVNVIAYLEYLNVINNNSDIVYPSFEECLNINQKAIELKTDTISIAIKCTGNRRIHISSIPSDILKSNGYL